MSKISADILRAKTLGIETPAVYPVRGSNKSWVNFNGTGTVAVRTSLNVSSITDNGTGDYLVLQSNVFASQPCGQYTVATLGQRAHSDPAAASAFFVSSQRVYCTQLSAFPPPAIDCDLVLVAVTGDLA